MNQETRQVSPHEGCFLCELSPELVYLDGPSFVAIAGLGPVVDGYSVVAAKAHFRSMADVPVPFRPERNATVEALRVQLSRRYGSCLLTEHGRMAVCDGDIGAHDAHCLHAHFLLFPGARDVSEIARSYFGHVHQYDDLDAALSHALIHPEYMLVSPNTECFYIFAQPLNIPRQLARYLVAHAEGSIHLADWRQYPNLDKARSIASELRSVFRPSGATDG